VIELKKTSLNHTRLLSILLAALMLFSVPGLAFAAAADSGRPAAGELAATATPGVSTDSAAPAAPDSPAPPPDTAPHPEGSGEADGGAPAEATPTLPTEPTAPTAPDPTAPDPALPAESEEEPAATEPTPEGAAALTTQALPDSLNGAIVTIAYNPVKTQAVDISSPSAAAGSTAILNAASVVASQRFRITAVGDGYYTLTNIRSQLLLDVHGAKAASGARIIQWTAHGGDNQKWAFSPNDDGSYTIVSKLSNAGRALCLDAFGASSTSGTQLILWEQGEGKPNQRFVLNPIPSQQDLAVADGIYTVRASLGTTLLDMEGNAYRNGAAALTYAPTGGYNQRFAFRYDATTGYYAIIALHSNRALDVEANSTAPGAAVIQWDNTGGFNQRWSIERHATNGTLIIKAANSGLALDVFGGSAKSGARIIVWPYHGGANQQWVLSPTIVFDSGIYSINVSDTAWLDVHGNASANGTNIATWTQTSGMNQRFFVNRVGDGIYTVEALNAAKYLTLESATDNAVLYERQDSDAQKWRFVPAGEGRFALQSLAAEGTALTAAALSGGANVGVAPFNLSDIPANQRWKFVSTQPITEGLYVFPSALDPSKALDIPGGTLAQGTGLTVWDLNEDKAQRFLLRRASGDSYQIVLLNSGMALDVHSGSVNTSNGSGTVIQWPASSPAAANQLWRVEYLGEGKIRFISALAGQRACLNITGGQALNGAAVGILDKNDSLAQAFLFKKLANITYENLNISLDQMTSRQNGAVYSNGSAWVAASYAQIYNALNPTQQQTDRMMQFVDLRISSGLTGAQIDAYINSGSDPRSLFRGLGATFVAAAKQYGINEAYFVSHAINETGWGKFVCGDAAFTGFTYDGKTKINGQTYPPGTYYNFWGIGAYDSNALSGGQNYAVSHGWNSPAAAIYGSAQWIASNYLYNGQPTLYDMRWDYTYYSGGGTGNGHKYATDIDWARKAARLMENLYNSTGTPTLYYVVPAYQ
jgi:beta-N-acetylglucosaminidase